MFSQARLILCQYINNFAALGLNPFYVVNILICTAWKSVIADLPLSGAYNQKMASIRLTDDTSNVNILVARAKTAYKTGNLNGCIYKSIHYQKANISPECSSTVYLSLRARIRA